MSEQDDFVSKFFLTLTEEIGSLLHKNRRKTLSITFYYNSNNSSRCLRKLYDFVRQEFLKSLFKNKGSSWVFLYIFLSINFFFFELHSLPARSKSKSSLEEDNTQNFKVSLS